MMSWLMLTVMHLVVIGVMALHPYIAAKAILFGVYVPEEERQHPEAANLRRKFALTVFVISVAADAAAAGIVISAGGGEEVLAPLLFPIDFVTVVSAYIFFRKAALRLKEQNNWQAAAEAGKRVVNLQFRQRVRSFSNAWYAVHLILVAICVISAVLMWDRIPDTLVTHYNGRWEADGWSAKSAGSVFQFNFVQLGMILLFLIINESIRSVKQVLDPARPEQSMEREIRFRKRNAVFLWGLSLIIVLLFALIQGSVLYGWSKETMMVLGYSTPAVIIVSVILFLIYISKEGWEAPNDPNFLQDNKWRVGGLFYYSKEDPALLVPKRIGVGYTINFAHPMGWVIMGGILAAPLLIILVTVIFAG